MTENNSENQEFPIWASFTDNSKPIIFDLSGVVPFELYLNGRRNAPHESDPRDLALLKAGSMFDLPAALSKGLVELVDQATGNVVLRHDDAAHFEAERSLPKT